MGDGFVVWNLKMMEVLSKKKIIRAIYHREEQQNGVGSHQLKITGIGRPVAFREWVKRAVLRSGRGTRTIVKGEGRQEGR